jgi:hypothetical protein
MGCVNESCRSINFAACRVTCRPSISDLKCAHSIVLKIGYTVLLELRGPITLMGTVRGDKRYSGSVCVDGCAARRVSVMVDVRAGMSKGEIRGVDYTRIQTE